MQASRSIVRKLSNSPILGPALKEEYNHHAETAAHHMVSWRKYSVVSVVGVVGLSAYMYQSVEPHFARGEYPYMGHRAKPFPWGADSFFGLHPHHGGSAHSSGGHH